MHARDLPRINGFDNNALYKRVIPALERCLAAT
jgi:hypothetical protein